MIVFEPIHIGPQCFVFSELCYKGALHIASIDKSLNEKRITEFFKFVLPNQDALKMTVQERYYLLIKYLSKQVKTMLEIDVNFSDYINSEPQEWKASITKNGVTVRQLYGFEAERLERDCESLAEWVACLMAVQLSIEDHEALHGVLDIDADDYEMQFMSRLTYIQKMPLSDWDEIYNSYFMLNQELSTHCDVVLCREEGLSQDCLGVRGGTDDAPMRFRPSAAFNRFFDQLEQFYYTESKAVG